MKCSMHDDGLWVHLDNARLHVPSDVTCMSEILTDVRSAMNDPSITKEFTLSVPEEWLRAWTACYCSGKKRLRQAEYRDLVHCLLVCFCSCNAAPNALEATQLFACEVFVFRVCPVLASSVLYC
jgi:hypothetical protein